MGLITTISIWLLLLINICFVIYAFRSVE